MLGAPGFGRKHSTHAYSGLDGVASPCAVAAMTEWPLPTAPQKSQLSQSSPASFTSDTVTQAAERLLSPAACAGGVSGLHRLLTRECGLEHM